MESWIEDRSERGTGGNEPCGSNQPCGRNSCRANYSDEGLAAVASFRDGRDSIPVALTSKAGAAASKCLVNTTGIIGLGAFATGEQFR